MQQLKLKQALTTDRRFGRAGFRIVPRAIAVRIPQLVLLLESNRDNLPS
jgi:hypothetical protein